MKFCIYKLRVGLAVILWEIGAWLEDRGAKLMKRGAWLEQCGAALRERTR
jgi:hypothetical protein